MLILGILIGILSLAFLVTAHEFGHFIMARRSGVKVNEFGICFPPRAIAWVKGKDGKWHKLPKEDWGKKQKSLIISLNWLPIGGFCAMDGESDADTKPGTFGATTFWNKAKILFGGVTMNWLIAIFIFTILAWTGMPQFLDQQFSITDDAHTSATAPITVSEVVSGSPADIAGFQAGDIITTVDGEAVAIAAEVISANQAHAGKSVTYGVIRDVEPLELTATLAGEDADYLLGIAMTSGQSITQYTWSAPIVGIGTTLQLTGETFKGLGEMLWNLISGVARLIVPDASVREAGQAAIATVGDSVSGPVGIVGVLFPSMVSYGPTNLFFFIALISVSLACMNVLPIPALDGGRFFLIALFHLRGKKLEKATEERIVSRAMYILITLIAIITILDIIRLF